MGEKSSGGGGEVVDAFGMVAWVGGMGDCEECVGEGGGGDVEDWWAGLGGWFGLNVEF